MADAEKSGFTVKSKTYRQLIKEADKYYSLMIRKENEKDGKVQCYTCWDWKLLKEIQCGHYISRRILSTRFYKKNTKPQCVRCNVFMEGNKPVFALRLKKEYGDGILEELDQLSRILVKYTREKLTWMIDRFKKETKK